MATPVDIIGGFYTVSGRSWAAQDCVNYLPMAAEVSGTKTQTMLRTPPGLRPWVKIGDGPDYAIRGLHDVEGALFVVSGPRLYQISNKGVAIPLGTIPGVGRVSMAHNQIAGGNQLLVVNGNAGYVWNTLTQTFERVTDEGYPGASVAQFVNSYLMQLEPFGRFLFFSDLADATAYNTLDRFEAEAQPDPIVSILTDQNEVVAFGTRTIQFFENTGAAQGTFQSKGVVISRGCAGRFTPVKIDNSLAWLGDDGVFYRLDGYSPRRISTHAIEEAIAGLNWSQAFGMVWTDQGHTVAYWTFPDGQTWGFDVSSGLWHRRASYHPAHEVSRRWRPSTLVRSNGQWIAGDATSGKLFVLDWGYMLEDADQPLVSERTTQIVFNSGSRFSVDAVDLWMRTGEKPSIGQSAPDQPVGPTITGDAPAGIVDEPYPQYDYEITQGDAPIVSVSILSGAVPTGLSFASGVIPGGTPTVIGTYSFKIRVRDSNGLFADLDDTIQIANAPLVAVILGTPDWVGGIRNINGSDDGTTWDSPFRYVATSGMPLFDNGGEMIGLGSTLIAWGGGSTANKPSRSLDGGYTWTQSLVNYHMGFTGVGVGGVAIIGGRGIAGTPMRRSTDGGATFVDMNTVPSYGLVSGIRGNDKLVVATSGEGSHYSNDAGLTWQQGGVTGLDVGGGSGSGFDDEFAYFCAAQDGVQKLVRTKTGIAYESVPLPQFPAPAPLLEVTGGSGIVVVCDAAGVIAYDDGTGFKLAEDSLGADPTGLIHTGMVFVIAGGQIIKTSEDGNTWTTRSTFQATSGLAAATIEKPNGT